MIGSSLNAQINTGISDRRKANIPVEFDRRQGDRRQSSAPVENERRRAAFAADNERRRTDRRQANIPVEIDRRQGDRRAISFTNDKTKPTNQGKGELLFEACEALPPIRRIKSLPDQITNGNGTTALGMAALAMINLPEDMRDVRKSGEQIECLIKHKKFEPKYDYAEYQHPFSFFRGTMLDKWLRRNLSQGKAWARWLVSKDDSIDTTIYGQKILKLLKTEEDKSIETDIKDFLGDNERAISYKGSSFGKLTARAMRRTTLLGLMAMCALEVPKIFHAACKEKDIKDKASSTTKQIGKSVINVASITAGIGYMGALGAKYGGPTGSIVGMGLGAVLGSKISQQTQKIIS